MSLRAWFILAAALSLIALGGWLTRARWKPALDRAVAAAFNAQDEAAAAHLEVEGAAETAEDMAAWSEQSAAARDATHALDIATREDPDAHTPLDPDRLARRREHDRRLCELRPAVCGEPAGGPTAPPAIAGQGARNLPPAEARP